MIGKLLDGRYQVTQVLSQGGFGRTFLAQDTKLPGNPICVVKQLHPRVSEPTFLEKAKELFEREAKILQQLGEHPNIPRLLAYFEEEGEFYLVEDYIRGKSLYEEIESGHLFSESEVINLLLELLNTLKFVHEHQVIHRDIKPENIIKREEDQRLFLIDFGSVKQVSESGEPSTTLIGTPGYIPLEQMVGNPQFSSDIYSLGILCIECLTGKDPREIPRSANLSQIYWRDLVQLRGELGDIIDKMVSHNYEDRYPSAKEALADVNRLICPPQSTGVPTQLMSPDSSSLDTFTIFYNNRNLFFLLITFIFFAAIFGIFWYQKISFPTPRLPLNGKLVQGFLNEESHFVGGNNVIENPNKSSKIYYHNNYYFRGEKGQDITIELTSNDLDTYLKLDTINGDTIAVNDDISTDNTNSKIEVTLPGTGIYKVIVSSSQPKEVGSYQISAKIKS